MHVLNTVCLQAIDFGRAIDLHLLPDGTQFEGVSTTDGMQCPEMLSGKPWHYCVRYHFPPFPCLILEDSAMYCCCSFTTVVVCLKLAFLLTFRCYFFNRLVSFRTAFRAFYIAHFI